MAQFPHLWTRTKRNCILIPMKRAKSLIILVALISFSAHHGFGLKNVILCMEPDGVWNLEFSKDGDCCGHSDSHSKAKDSGNLEQGECEDYPITYSEVLQKTERPVLPVNFSLALLTYYITWSAPEIPTRLNVTQNDILPKTVDLRTTTVLLI